MNQLFGRWKNCDLTNGLLPQFQRLLGWRFSHNLSLRMHQKMELGVDWPGSKRSSKRSSGKSNKINRREP